MATKKELEKRVREQKKEIGRLNGIVEKLRTNLSMLGIKAFRTAERRF